MSTNTTPQYTQLGSTDISISPIGIGTWAWGDRIVWGYGGKYSDSDLQNVFDTTLAAGINFFDTAEVYGFGRSEKLLGQFIREVKHPVITATKFMPYPWRVNRTSLIKALRRSLKRLGMEKVDLYQIHWPLRPVPLETWVREAGKAYQAGLARAVGISNYNLEQTQRAHEILADMGIPLASNQVEYSLINRKIEKTGLLDYCQQNNITIIAYSPLGMGMLTGKYTPVNPPSGVRGRRYNPEFLGEIQSLIELMRGIGQAHGGKTPAQVAINWAICKGTVPIPGAKNIRQAAENVGAIGWRLTVEEVAALGRIRRL